MRFLFRLFDIRQAEWSTVSMLLAHAFFNGLGIALCFTAANLLFLESFGAEKLPTGYAVSGVVLLISGFIYAKLEHAMSPSDLFKRVLVVCAVLVSLCWLGLVAFQSVYMVFFLFVAYWVIYTLINLEFWGVAALLFDVRQSKRLFGLVSSGESVAKICGYLITPVIVSYFSNAGLAIVSGLALAVSTYFIWKITKEKGAKLQVEHHHQAHHHHDPMGVKAIADTLKNDKFIFWISLMAMIGILVYFTIKYAFLKRVEETMHSQEEIATFFGLFFGIGKAVNFLTKSLFAGRLMKRVGVKSLILALPLVLLVVNTIGVAGRFLGAEMLFFVWIFGFNMLFDEIGRSSMLKPAFLVLFQPLHHLRRLQGHTVSKGIMEPLGMALGGLILLLILHYFGLDLKVVSKYLLVLLVIWVLVGIKVNKEYVAVLNGALVQRFLGSNRVDVAENTTRTILFEKLESNNPLDIIYALNILDIKRVKNLEDVLRRAFVSDNSLVIKTVLDLVESENIAGLSNEVKALFNHQDFEVKEKALMVYGAINNVKAIDDLSDIYNNSDGATSEAALASILKSCGIYGATSFGKSLLDLIEGEQKEKAKAARIIGNVKEYSYYHPLASLLTYNDQIVVKNAIRASGEVRNENLLPYLFKMLKQREHYSLVTSQLHKFGDKLFDHLTQDVLDSEDCVKAIIKASAEINSERSILYIYNQLNGASFGIRRMAIHALFETGYFANDTEEKECINELIQNQISVYAGLLSLQGDDGAEDSLLIDALMNERSIVQKSVLYLLSFLYDRETIINIKDSLFINAQEVRANALERLELLVDKQIRREVLNLFDNSSANDLLDQFISGNKLHQNKKELVIDLLESRTKVSLYLRGLLLNRKGELLGNAIKLETVAYYCCSTFQFLVEEAYRYVQRYNKDLVPKLENVNLPAARLEYLNANKSE
ncbi:MAG: MFS transporter [Bacteroidia bacterium]